MIKAHLPALREEVLEVLAPKPGQIFLDCTFGGGGHSQAILNACPDTQVIGIDCDPEAQKRSVVLKQTFCRRFHFYDLNFAELDRLPICQFDGILFDLGVSSFQLDSPERGFSFRYSAVPDMRLNPRHGISAADFLGKATKAELIQAIRDYGEEKHWRRVVTTLIQARGKGILKDTSALAHAIATALPTNRGKPSAIHPATRSFQGIRMAINAELDSLETALPKAFNQLVPKGVLAVISFHSLEDRIVKRFFRRMAGLPEHARDSLPQDLRSRYAKILTHKPVRPKEVETQRNPRSRSARLRALYKY